MRHHGPATRTRANREQAIYLFHVDAPQIADPGDEHGIQVRLLRAIKTLAPAVRVIAIPNAARRTAWEAQRLKTEGLAKGAPDIMCLWAGGGCAFLEMKARGGALKPEQHDYLNWLAQRGFRCGVFRSVKTALAFLEEEGAPFLFAKEAA